MSQAILDNPTDFVNHQRTKLAAVRVDGPLAQLPGGQVDYVSALLDLSNSPDEFAGAVDEVCDVRHDLLTTLGLDGRVEQEREVVDVLSARHCGPHGSNVGRTNSPCALPEACAATSSDSTSAAENSSS